MCPVGGLERHIGLRSSSACAPSSLVAEVVCACHDEHACSVAAAVWCAIMLPAPADTASSGLTYRYNESRSAIKDDFEGLMVCLVRTVPTPARYVPERDLPSHFDSPVLPVRHLTQLSLVLLNITTSHNTTCSCREMAQGLSPE